MDPLVVAMENTDLYRLELSEIEELNACIKRTKDLYIRLIKKERELKEKITILKQTHYNIIPYETHETYEEVVNNRLLQDSQIKTHIHRPNPH